MRKQTNERRGQESERHCDDETTRRRIVAQSRHEPAKADEIDGQERQESGEPHPHHKGSPRLVPRPRNRSASRRCPPDDTGAAPSPLDAAEREGFESIEPGESESFGCLSRRSLAHIPEKWMPPLRHMR